MAGRISVGTSGWNYQHWRKKFYPEGVASKHWLEFYAESFSTAEVNYSFYRLPKAETFEKWYQQVPDDFIFACKASRYLTHNLKLSHAADAWSRVITPMAHLEDKLGPVLLQFPDHWQKNYDRLAEFLQMTKSNTPEVIKLRLAFEFRHQSWLADEIYELLREYDAAFCIVDSNQMPRTDVITASFAYYRFHGRTRKYGSRYTDAELQEEEAAAMKKLARRGTDVFAYFNNDAQAYAVENAQTLMHYTQLERARRGTKQQRSAS